MHTAALSFPNRLPHPSPHIYTHIPKVCGNFLALLAYLINTLKYIHIKVSPKFLLVAHLVKEIYRWTDEY